MTNFFDFHNGGAFDYDTLFDTVETGDDGVAAMQILFVQTKTAESIARKVSNEAYNYRFAMTALVDRCALLPEKDRLRALRHFYWATDLSPRELNPLVDGIQRKDGDDSKRIPAEVVADLAGDLDSGQTCESCGNSIMWKNRKARSDHFGVAVDPTRCSECKRREREGK